MEEIEIDFVEEVRQYTHNFTLAFDFTFLININGYKENRHKFKTIEAVDKYNKFIEKVMTKRITSNGQTRYMSEQEALENAIEKNELNEEETIIAKERLKVIAKGCKGDEER